MTSSSRGDLYFQCAVVVITFVGLVANGLVLYAILAAKQHKKHPLIVNQNLLDFVSCLFLATMFTIRLCNIYLSGTSGYWLCLLFLNDGFSWAAFLGSLINLAAITIERYLKIVHTAWAQKKLRNWMIYSAMAFAWIGGIATSGAAVIHTTRVVDGYCYALVFWTSKAARMAFGIWYFMSFYVIILLIFIFCYGRILMFVRRQASVMAGHAAAAPSNTQLSQIQIKVVKTMILVSALYVITYTPLFVISIRRHRSADANPRDNAFFVTMAMGYFYNCANPFIYATKFDPVRRVLLGLIPCKKTSQPVESIGMA